jgi:HEAT repeat protein
MKNGGWMAMFCAVVCFCFCGNRVWSAEEDPLIGDKPLSEVLKQFESQNRGEQLRAARALAAAEAQHHAAIVPKLISYLTSERENTRLPAIQTLGEYGAVSRAAVPLLLPLLEGTQFERNRSASAKALGQILKDAQPGEEVEKVAAALAKAFGDKYEDVRREAVFAIGMIGPAAKSVIPAVGSRLSDAQPVRNAAAWTCGRMGKLAACHTDRLISLMQGEQYPQTDLFFAGAVPEALGLIGATHENVVPNIVDKLEAIVAGSAFHPQHNREGGRMIFMQGIKALERMGADAKVATPYLHRLLRGNPYGDWERTLAVIRAIKAIGPGAAETVPELKAIAEASKPGGRLSQENFTTLKDAAAEALKTVAGAPESSAKNAEAKAESKAEGADETQVKK